MAGERGKRMRGANAVSDNQAIHNEIFSTEGAPPMPNEKVKKELWCFDGHDIKKIISAERIEGLKDAFRIEYEQYGFGSKTKTGTTIGSYIFSDKESLVSAIEDHIDYLTDKIKELN